MTKRRNDSLGESSLGESSLGEELIIQEGRGEKKSQCPQWQQVSPKRQTAHGPDLSLISDRTESELAAWLANIKVAASLTSSINSKQVHCQNDRRKTML